MQIQAACATDLGRVRTLNEDFALVDDALGLYVVCDGMGGHAAGEVASRLAATHVQDALRESRSVLEAAARGGVPIDAVAARLRAAVESASHAIHELGRTDPSRKGMGTTLVAVVVCGGKAVMAHVGDSRLYLSRAGQVHQLSEDHTFVQEALRAGMLTHAQAKQSEHGNILTRAVGPLDRVVVDTLVFDLVVGDTLLLCSDGLHHHLDEAGALSALLAAPTLDAIPARCVALANEGGGHDNITALVVRASLGESSTIADTDHHEAVTQTFAALTGVSLFEDLSMAELVRVSNTGRSVSFPAGQVVIREGDATEQLFVVESGSVEVSRGGERLAVLERGAHVGEMALLSQRPRSATVTTREPTRLLVLDRASLHSLWQHEPLLAAKFLWKLAQTLSLRLDDAHAAHALGAPVRGPVSLPVPSTTERASAPAVPTSSPTAAKASRSTVRFGLYPSPFRSPST